MNRIRYSSRPIAIDFFAGAGGLSLGLEQAGFDVVLAVDRDGHHTATHERNFPYGIAVCASIADLDARGVREWLGTDREIDLIAGGPPCQGFSSMGTRDVADPRNSLVNEYVRLVLELRPKAFLMENVPGMQHGATAEIFNQAVAQWEANGYVITKPVQTLNAASLGVPQNRERLFVLGIRADLGRAVFYPSVMSGGPITVEDAIEDLPQVADHPEMLDRDWTAYDEPRPNISSYARILRGLDFDASDFSHPRLWDRARCTCSAAVRHRADISALYAATRHGEMVPGHKLPKLQPNGFAPTLRAGSESEHGSYTAPRPVHPREARCITAREAARLHGYPDWFRFYPSKWHAYRQIGNSVCPPVARALGSAFVTALGLHPERPSEPLALPDEFVLPDNRPRQHRRITQLSEWPKILEYLLSKALDPDGRLVRSDFSVDDVEAAYVATAANMPRNPARRFLADLARSRNVNKLLKPIFDAGLSILEVNDGTTYGRFVPRTAPGSIDSKQTLSISSRDLPSAVAIRTKLTSPLSDRSLIQHLRRRLFSKALFGGGKITIEGPRNLLGELEGSDLRFDLIKGGRRAASGQVMIVRNGNLPTLEHLRYQMMRRGDLACVVLMPMTREHLAAFWVVVNGEDVGIRKKAVFRFAAGSESEPSKGQLGTVARVASGV